MFKKFLSTFQRNKFIFSKIRHKHATTLIMHAPCKLKKLFSYKDKQPHLQQFNVIYQLKCDCGASYIGQTGRNLITRLNYHNINLPFRQKTDVSKHQVDNLNHKIDFNNCAILGFSNHWRKRLIKESLYIQKFNPFMNIDKNSSFSIVFV